MARIKFARPVQPGPVQIPNCAEVRFLWLQNGVLFSNVLHGNLTAVGPISPNIAEAIFSAIKANAATTAWLAYIHPSASMTGVQVKDLRAINNPSIPSSGVPIVGTGTGAPLGQNTALVVTQRTQFSGRGYFGRIYLGGLTDATLSDARTFDTQLVTPAAVAFANAMNAAMTAQGLPWVLAQRALLASPNPAAPPPYNQPRGANVLPIQSAVVSNPRIDSMRRRTGR